MRTAEPRVIGYLARILPILSETFVVREIAELRRLGVDVRPFSLYPPDLSVAHSEAPDLAREVEIFVRPKHFLFWAAHLTVLLRSPIRYFRCLWQYVLAASEPWRRRFRCLMYFAIAPFAAVCLRRAGVSHLHAHFANAATSVAMMAAELAGIPFSFTAHAYDIFVDDLLLPAKIPAAAFVATCSQFNVHYLREHYPAAAEAVINVVHVGVDPAVFTPRPAPQGEPPLVLAVGRLVETKGFHTLIEACAQLLSNGVDSQCHIIGEGPEAERLSRMITALRLSERVALLGKLPPAEVLAYYHKASLFVMPSCVRRNNRDGIPTVLIEALAMGIPVVSTRVSGIPELVRDGETGLLADPDDPAGLAEAIIRLLDDRELAARLAQAGRELVLREFNIRVSVQKLLHLFAGTRNFQEQI
jgi:colanic acid/amylovoran biosynthesis glycosyltransferase